MKRNICILIAAAALLLSMIACESGALGDYPTYDSGTYSCPQGQYLGSMEGGQRICRWK